MSQPGAGPQQMIFTGTAIGGPLDGQECTCRTPDGFILVDRPAGRAWLYKRGDGGDWFLSPGPHGQEWRPYDPAKALDAAMGDTHDVRSVPGWPKGRDVDGE